MTNTCSTCRRCAEFEGVCCNGDGECRGDFRDNDQGCERWENSDNLSQTLINSDKTLIKVVESDQVKKEANMDKPLKDWTFSEAQEFCKAQRNTPERCSTCKIKEFCDKYFGRQGESASPKYWDLSEKPRFTEQEVEDAKAVRRVLGHEYRLERTPEGTISFGGLILSTQLFPSIQPGQSCTLDDIIGGADNA